MGHWGSILLATRRPVSPSMVALALGHVSPGLVAPGTNNLLP